VRPICSLFAPYFAPIAPGPGPYVRVP
jgi:hypothetical protein